ncbi:MAG TPA: hypothetical protein VK272_11875 [Solirubrobacteraceae bacterium]|nr:hypothetical protein [Solirubrobacteraceae bacterium]
MSTPYPQLATRVGAGHPAVLSRRARERMLVGVSALVPLVIALAISIAMPQPEAKSVAEVIGGLIGVVGISVLVVSTRYSVTLTVLAVYLGLMDGPIKEFTASKLASGFRDILILAIALGMLMRLVSKRERVAFAPLSGLVLGFVTVTVFQAFNPDTNGFLKILGGYRQQLEFVPIFFFAYMIMRNKQRFRQLFLILGVIALANGMVGAYQARLTPAQLAGWGPGYGEKVKGNNGGGLTGRTYSVEGEGHNRPPALGSDSGFGGGVGVLALPGLMALLVAGRLRRRWPVMLLCLGALAGVATAASRTSVITAIIALTSFGALSIIARLRVGRPLAGVAAVAVLAGGVVFGLAAIEGSSIFHRQESIIKIASGEQTGGDAKSKHLNEVPRDLVHAPFGLGLGVSGAVAGFGGKERVTIENEKVSGGSAFNLLAVEVGAPGLILWVGLTASTLLLGIRRLRRIVDPELRVYLVAVLASYATFTVQGFVGTTLAVTPGGAYIWFVPGVVAYWFLGPGWKAMAAPRGAATGVASGGGMIAPSVA